MRTPREVTLAALLLSRYLFFLTQRPISRSNVHYLHQRIEGLRALAPLLESEAGAVPPQVATLLRGLAPDNLRETAGRLQLALLPLAERRVPADFITSDRPPPPEFVGTARRVTLLFGPAIGIGDEIMCVPLPAWVKQANADARVRVVTAYEGVWTDAAGVDEVTTYRDHRALLDHLRGVGDGAAADLVVLVDFENPDLHRAVPGAITAARYAEVSVGGRVVVAVDTEARWIHRCPLPHGRVEQFYDGVDRAAAVLGIGPGPRPRPWPAPTPLVDHAGPLRILVSPFTSKDEPSPRFWSRLLSTLVPPGAARPVRVLIDPGPSRATRCFAEDLRLAAAAASDGGDAEFALVPGEAHRGLPLVDVLAAMETVDVVVCTDSYAAHAAPLRGCTTLVVARPGLEDWRVPHPRSFYFDGVEGLAAVAAGMRQILGHHGLLGHPHPDALPLAAPERRVLAAGAALGAALDTPDDHAALVAAHGAFVAARDEVVRRRSGWAPAVRGLLSDSDYDEDVRPLPQLPWGPAAVADDVVAHARETWLRWRNTNLAKYLRLAADETALVEVAR